MIRKFHRTLAEPTSRGISGIATENGVLTSADQKHSASLALGMGVGLAAGAFLMTFSGLTGVAIVASSLVGLGLYMGVERESAVRELVVDPKGRSFVIVPPSSKFTVETKEGPHSIQTADSGPWSWAAVSIDDGSYSFAPSKEQIEQMVKAGAVVDQELSPAEEVVT